MLSEPTKSVYIEDLSLKHLVVEPRFVGRTREMAVLSSMLAESFEGATSVCVVQGESGIGKSRMLAEFSKKASQKGATVFSTTAASSSANRPFDILSGIFCSILDSFGAREADAQVLKSQLGDLTSVISTAVPDLEPLFGTGISFELHNERFGEQRSVDAIYHLFNALGTPNSPAVLIIDNCQWADYLTQIIFKKWKSEKRRVKAGSHLMVVLAYRTERASILAPDLEADVFKSLSLQPLERRDVHDFVQMMVGRVSHTVIDNVMAYSEGNPFMVNAVLRGMVESGCLAARSDGLHFVESENEAPFSRQAAGILIGRLRLLPVNTQRLLQIGAVLGKEFPVDLLEYLSGSRAVSGAIKDHLDLAERRHFIRMSPDRSICSFVHDKVREALLSLISETDRSQFHSLAARFLLEHDSRRVSEISAHYVAAGDLKRAFPFSIRAGKEARARYAFEIAAREFSVAFSALPLMDRSLQLEVTNALGEVNVLLGHYEIAESLFKEALTLVRTPAEEADVVISLGDVAFKKGDVPQAKAFALKAIDLLGGKNHRSIWWGFGLVYQIMIRILHICLPRLFLHRKANIENMALEMRALDLIEYVSWFGGGMLWGLRYHLRGINLAESAPLSNFLPKIYSHHGIMFSSIPIPKLALRYIQKAYWLYKVLDNYWGQGVSLGYWGSTLYSCGRYEESLKKCEAARGILQKTGDVWEANTAGYISAYCQYRLGYLRDASLRAIQVYGRANEVGDHVAICNALCVFAKVTFGRIPVERLQHHLAKSSADRATVSQLYICMGILYLRQRQFEKAVQVLQKAEDLVHRPRIHNEWTVASNSWLLTAMRMQLENETSVDKCKLDRALKLCRTARFNSFFFEGTRPHNYREVALVFALKGQMKRSKRFFEKSVRAAQKLGMTYELAQTKAEMGRIGSQIGWGNAAAFLEEGRRSLERFETSIADIGWPEGS